MLRNLFNPAYFLAPCKALGGLIKNHRLMRSSVGLKAFAALLNFD